VKERIYTVPLSKGKVALVSQDDYEECMQFKWYASQESAKGKKWYAIRWATKKEYGDSKRYKIRMHRYLLGLPPGVLDDSMVVDHIQGKCALGHKHTGDGLDNRRCGLEICTQKENMNRADGWKRPAPEPFL
jgi:hypothetical protein